MFIFGKEYEVCKTCEILKQQLAIVNQERRDLLDTVLSIVKPEAIVANPVPVQALRTVAMPWNQRRKILEQEDAKKAQIQQESLKLEKELGIPEDKEDAGQTK